MATWLLILDESLRSLDRKSKIEKILIWTRAERTFPLKGFKIKNTFFVFIINVRITNK